jgi:NMD protein affecting ribosome stability and mRNA decay
MKTCFKCGAEKDESEFYRHPRMADGLLGKCKECTKIDSTAHRNANLERCREFDRKRGARQTSDYHRRYRKRFPAKHKATSMVNNAIRDGKMRLMPCEVCGSDDRPHAHHDDYSAPLNVRWLCPAHHKEWHQHNDALNP